MEVKELRRRYRKGKSTYDKFPTVKVSREDSDCVVGWEAIAEELNVAINSLPVGRNVVILETYHGVSLSSLQNHLISRLAVTKTFSTQSLFKSPEQLDTLFAEALGSHPVFGYLSDFDLVDFFDLDTLTKMQAAVTDIADVCIIFGPGASLVAQNADLVIYADMARWELQQRMRRQEVTCLGSDDLQLPTSTKYKRGYFIDWRACDKLKRQIFKNAHYLLDTHLDQTPKLVEGSLIRSGLRMTTEQPFRVVPFFDPGIWGGQWMREVCDLSPEPVNFAWCFDCVPEENSLLLSFGSHTFEMPAINVVFEQPEALLGSKIYDQFGAEFPIRFDFLDTMDGGNLSLQVHPIKEYMREHFGLPYTQDESYYILDAEQDAVVYLGLQEDANLDNMWSNLEVVQRDQGSFNAEKYVQQWPVQKHDHILIPAGTIHCSGKNSMVLEISATPYIFTFKLWDWDRVDLNGKPRPISLNHGKKVLQEEWRKEKVGKELINCFEEVASGDGWREEKTGLHASEFIETRRHWFTARVSHDTQGNLNVLNLVQGEEVLVESPTNGFEPFVVHYAETFIIPAKVGAYTIKPIGPNRDKLHATMKAFVR